MVEFDLSEETEGGDVPQFDLTPIPGEKPELSIGERVFDEVMSVATPVITALDYGRNVVATYALAEMQDKDAWPMVKEAIQNKRITTSDQIRKAAGFASYGADDGKWQAEDALDIVRDFTLDIAMDPLTYISFGAGPIIKSAMSSAVKSAGKEFAQKTTTEIAEKIAKRGEVPPELGGVDMDTLIKKGKEAGVLGGYEEAVIRNESRNALEKAKIASAIGVKNQFANVMGGLYGAAYGIDEETELSDIARDFAVGYGATALGRRVYKNHVADRLKTVGAKINRAFLPSAARTEMMALKGRRYGDQLELEKQAIPTDIDPGTTANYANASTQNRRTAENLIAHDLLLGLEKMKQNGSASDVYYALKAHESLADMVVKGRERDWRKFQKQVGGAWLREQGIEPGSGWGKALKYATDKPLIQQIQNEITENVQSKYYTMTPEGTYRVKRKYIEKWAERNEIENLDTVTTNMDIWNDAIRKTSDTELEWFSKNYMDEELPFFIEKRAEAVGKFGEKIKAAKLINQNEIKETMELAYGNIGLASWTPTIAERSLAITKEAGDESMKKAVRETASRKLHTKEMKRRTGQRADIKKEVLGGKTLREVTEEEADVLVRDYEAAAMISAKEKAQYTLNTVQQEAIQNLTKWQDNYTQFRKNLIKLNSIVKKGLLLGSVTWIKNNYWSNMRQAFANQGIMGVLDAGQIVSFKNKMNDDLQKLYMHRQKTTPVFEHSSEVTADMMKRDVIDSAHLRDIELLDKDYERFIRSDDEIARRLDQSKGEGKISKMLDAVNDHFDWMSSRFLHTQQVSRYIEAFARANTYKRTYDLLQKSIGDDLAKYYGKDAAAEAIKDQAANVTKDVFFDYGKLNYWEASFARQVIPFYSFYKQNLFFQTKALVDPDKAGRLGTLARIGEGRYFASEPMTEEQRRALPDHFNLNSAARLVDPDTGDVKILYSTSDVAQAAWQMYSHKYWSKMMFKEYINPMMKSLIEIGFDIDFFRGEALSPQSLPGRPEDRKKYMFSSGYVTQLLYNTMQEAIDGSQAIRLDERGNPVTNKAWVARVDNVASWFGAMHFNLLKQVGGQVGKVYYGKQDIPEMMMNLAGPVSISTLIPEQQERALERARREIEEEKLEETYDALFKAKTFDPYER